jgi:beta-glucosidase
VLFGSYDPSGHLTVTFPTALSQVPASTTAQWPGSGGNVQYSEGIDVGYRWYDSKNLTPLFPFGYGLSYTTYAYSGLTVDDASHTVHFTVRNTGAREGTEIAQVYVALPSAAKENYKRLAAFQRVKLAPGQSKEITLTLNQLCLSVFNTDQNGWQLLPGEYNVTAGPSSSDTPLKATLHVHP